MHLVMGENEHVGSWIVDRIDHFYDLRDLDHFETIGVVASDGALMAAALYNNYTGTDIQITFAAATPRWATRSNIRAFLSYPFETAGCARCTALIDRKNKRVRKLLEGLGFKLEGKHPRLLNGKGTAFSLGLLPENRCWPNGERWG